MAIARQLDLGGLAGVEVLQEGPPNGTFGPICTESAEGPKIYIMGAGELTEDEQLVIFLHELGHYRQNQVGALCGWSREPLELDADAFAYETACRVFGMMNVRTIREGIFAKYSHGDPEATTYGGTYAERLEKGMQGAPSCRPPASTHEPG